MRSSRTARKIVGSLSAAAVSVLLLGGAAAVTSDGSAGHGLRTGTTQNAGDDLQLSAFSISSLTPTADWASGYSLSGHGLSGHGLRGHGLSGHGLSGHGLSGVGSSTAGQGLETASYDYGL